MLVSARGPSMACCDTVMEIVCRWMSRTALVPFTVKCQRIEQPISRRFEKNAASNDPRVLIDDTDLQLEWYVDT